MIESSEARVGSHNNVNQDQADIDGQTESTKQETQSESPQISSAAHAELQTKLQELENQVKDKDAKYVYLYAEFDNFKKRAIKERSDLIKFGWESVARDLLQVIDNLERALEHAPSQTEKSLMDGLKMVQSQFLSTLQKQGVQIIESINKEFDPNLHEAVGEEESEKPAGTIIRELSRGYTLHGRLLRPSRVVISKQAS